AVATAHSRAAVSYKRFVRRVVTRFVAEVTRFGAAVVQRLRARTCAARASLGVVRALFGGSGSQLSRRATKDRLPPRHEAATCHKPPRGRPFGVLVRTVRHLQSIASSAAKALTPIGISTRHAAGADRRLPLGPAPAHGRGNCHGRS